MSFNAMGGLGQALQKTQTQNAAPGAANAGTLASLDPDVMNAVASAFNAFGLPNPNQAAAAPTVTGGQPKVANVAPPQPVAAPLGPLPEGARPPGDPFAGTVFANDWGTGNNSDSGWSLLPPPPAATQTPQQPTGPTPPGEIPAETLKAINDWVQKGEQARQNVGTLETQKTGLMKQSANAEQQGQQYAGGPDLKHIGLAVILALLGSKAGPGGIDFVNGMMHGYEGGMNIQNQRLAQTHQNLLNSFGQQIGAIQDQQGIAGQQAKSYDELADAIRQDATKQRGQDTGYAGKMGAAQTTANARMYGADVTASAKKYIIDKAMTTKGLGQWIGALSKAQDGGQRVQILNQIAGQDPELAARMAQNPGLIESAFAQMTPAEQEKVNQGQMYQDLGTKYLSQSDQINRLTDPMVKKMLSDIHLNLSKYNLNEANVGKVQALTQAIPLNTKANTALSYAKALWYQEKAQNPQTGSGEAYKYAQAARKGINDTVTNIRGQMDQIAKANNGHMPDPDDDKATYDRFNALQQQLTDLTKQQSDLAQSAMGLKIPAMDELAENRKYQQAFGATPADSAERLFYRNAYQLLQNPQIAGNPQARSAVYRTLQQKLQASKDVDATIQKQMPTLFGNGG